MEEIKNIRSIELADGESLTDVDMAELSETGLLKVYLRTTANNDQVLLRRVSYFPAHAWRRINLDLYTLLIHTSNNATETLTGLDTGAIEEEIFSRLTADGVAETNARGFAVRIASGEEDNRPAGKSMHVFQRVG
ncbi:hypothetical protein [Mycobacteroides abscessus]|uniref:hypothetical protein n=1 Tax=Mycobacteroides abscessus TaxID=36809 RepID=UPI0019D31C80|nr:hypothetical protein [Mycobacteroides abscessus]MBN7386196.1 hypothetical protein [Mycobacteroides abscessus subsp. abscessus]MBN7418965.1 hypothetical protein [Mycobacteroides abscessus subsp. abscessus]